MNVVRSGLQDALVQLVAGLKGHNGTTGLGGKEINAFWAAPIFQERCQVFYLRSLGLILINLQGSRFYRPVIGELQKLGNFLKVWNGAEPRWKSWSAMGFCSFHTRGAPWGQFTHQFLGDYMGNAAHCCVLGGMKESPHVFSPCTEGWNCRVTGLDCGQRKAAPLVGGSTCPRSWMGQVGAHRDVPWGKGPACCVF